LDAITLEALQIPPALLIAITVSFTDITFIVVAAFFISQSQRRWIHWGQRRRNVGSTIVDLPSVGIVDPSISADGSIDELVGLGVMKIVGHAGVWTRLWVEFKWCIHFKAGKDLIGRDLAIRKLIAASTNELQAKICRSCLELPTPLPWDIFESLIHVPRLAVLNPQTLTTGTGPLT
jgi:hypothetical protein